MVWILASCFSKILKFLSKKKHVILALILVLMIPCKARAEFSTITLACGIITGVLLAEINHRNFPKESLQQPSEEIRQETTQKESRESQEVPKKMTP